MKLILEIYIKALGIYAFITIPALKSTALYFPSLFCAVVFGSAAWLFFSIVMGIVQYTNGNSLVKWIMLIISVPVGVAIGHTLIELFGLKAHVWRLNKNLLFPLAAVIAGWISLWINKTKITETFTEMKTLKVVDIKNQKS